MIDKNKFLDWAKQKLGNYIESEPEIRFKSIWCEDKGHHLYCNIYGGKNKIPFGVYQCWKSNKKGTLIKLIMELDKCSYNDALYTLGLKNGPRPIEEMSYDDENQIFDLPDDSFQVLSMPLGIVKYQEASEYWKTITANYLTSRCINPEFFYIGIDGRYKNRVIIPYYDEKGNLIYYNGRSLFNNKLRYLGPTKDIGVGKSDVIFMYKWFSQNDKIYLCEGEFDSISLNNSGLIGCAVGGKFVSIKQATILANKRVCLAFDNDDAGKDAIISSKKMLQSFGCTVSTVCPPDTIKDWNEFICKYGQLMVNAYIQKSEELL